MKRLVLACIAIAPLAIPAGALACSPIPDYRPPSAEEQARGVREAFRRAHAVVEVVAETGSNYPRAGRMRVLRVYKGRIRVGSRFAMTSLPGPACGPGDFPSGARGVMMLHEPRGTLSFQGFIAPGHVAMLRREGLLPAR